MHASGPSRQVENLCAAAQGEHFVAFDDGEQTSLDLAQEHWRNATQEVGSFHRLQHRFYVCIACQVPLLHHRACSVSLRPHLVACLQDEEEAMYNNGLVPVGSGKPLHKPRKKGEASQAPLLRAATMCVAGLS